MLEGMEIEVEIVDFDEEGVVVFMKKKCFLFNGFFKVGWIGLN